MLTYEKLSEALINEFVNDIGPVKRVKKLYEFNATKKVPCRTKFHWNQQVHLIEQVGATPCKYYISI